MRLPFVILRTHAFRLERSAMSEHDATSTWALITPVLVPLAAGLLGVLGTHLLLSPFLKYRRIKYAIPYVLIFESGLIMSLKYSDAPKEHMRVLRRIRSLAVKLRLSRDPLLQALGLIPRDRILREASGRMFRIANRMYENNKPFDELYDDMREIGRLLRIDVGNIP